MREQYEFRIPEYRAAVVLPPSIGTTLSGTSVRKVVVMSSEPEFALIRDASIEADRRGGHFETWADVTRIYEQHELDSANLFHLVFERRSLLTDAGEEHGTKYDERLACAICGAGAVQTSPLHLKTNNSRKRGDLRQTLGSEILISRVAAECLTSAGIRGLAVAPAYTGNQRSPSTDWLQLHVPIIGGTITEPTKTGSSIFNSDPTNSFRCAIGPLIGLNLHSEITLRRYDAPSDIFATAEYIGTRRGLFRPSRPVIVSAAFRNAFLQAKLKGVIFEVAHVL